jgi:hypothetical protein
MLGELSEQTGVRESDVESKKLPRNWPKGTHTSLQQVHSARIDETDVVDNDRAGVVELGAVAAYLDAHP